MSNAIFDKLSDSGLSIDELRENSNKTNEINKIIAAHPNADSDLLDELLEFRGEDAGLRDLEVITIALKNPNISLDNIIRFGRDNPKAVLENPSFAAILKKKPDLYKNIPEMLHQINCPEKLLLRAAKEKNEEFWPDILMNPFIPASLIDTVNSKNLFDSAKRRLQDFKDQSDVDSVGQYLSAYLDTVRPFFVPRFLKFDGNIREHRLSDQVLCGFPFTSQKWSWPIGSNSLHMQPVAQINLENAGKLLSLPLGSGLLQIWGCVGLGLRDHLIRVIPLTDLSDSIDSFYPPDAAWLKTDHDGAPEFENCIVSIFSLEDYRPFKIANCRIEWVDMGRMFYPSVSLRISQPLLQDESDQKFDVRSDLWTILEKLDDEIDKLRLPTGLNRFGNRLFVLGGYADGLGETWHTGAGDLVLYHSVDLGFKRTIALYCKSDEDGSPVFVVEINCDN